MLHTVQRRPVPPSNRVNVGVSTGPFRAMGWATDLTPQPPSPPTVPRKGDSRLSAYANHGNRANAALPRLCRTALIFWNNIDRAVFVEGPFPGRRACDSEGLGHFPVTNSVITRACCEPRRIIQSFPQTGILWRLMMLIDELENHIKIMLALPLLANEIISNDIHAWKLIRPFWPFMANGGL